MTKESSRAGKQINREAKRPKKKIGKRLYILAIILFGMIFLTTVVLPLFFDFASVIYRPEYLRIVYLILSLAIAIVTFGLIGDSEAVLKYEKPNGIYIQMTGSAAGAAFFFFLLSYGLNPYSPLTIFLYKNSDSVLDKTDGKVEVRVLSRQNQFVETTETGQARFSIPRSEKEVRVFIKGIEGRKWKIARRSPKKCFGSEGRVSIDCEEINFNLEREPICITDFNIGMHEVGEVETTLKYLVKDLTDRMRSISSESSITYLFTPAVVSSGLHEKEFTIARTDTGSQKICNHLASIENEFNLSQGKRLIRTFVRCDQILVALYGEQVKKEFKPCLN
jgi:hypothetical protein